MECLKRSWSLPLLLLVLFWLNSPVIWRVQVFSFRSLIVLYVHQLELNEQHWKIQRFSFVSFRRHVSHRFIRLNWFFHHVSLFHCRSCCQSVRRCDPLNRIESNIFLSISNATDCNDFRRWWCQSDRSNSKWFSSKTIRHCSDFSYFDCYFTVGISFGRCSFDVQWNFVEKFDIRMMMFDLIVLLLWVFTVKISSTVSFMFQTWSHT